MSDSLQEIKDAANRLVDPVKQRKPLPDPVARPAIADGIGFAEPQAPTKGGAGGIASPLTEASFSKREYHAERIVSTSDAMITESKKPIKKVVMVDALKAGVVFIYAEPPAPTE